MPYTSNKCTGRFQLLYIARKHLILSTDSGVMWFSIHMMRTPGITQKCLSTQNSKLRLHVLKSQICANLETFTPTADYGKHYFFTVLSYTHQSTTLINHTRILMGISNENNIKFAPSTDNNVLMC